MKKIKSIKKSTITLILIFFMLVVLFSRHVYAVNYSYTEISFQDYGIIQLIDINNRGDVLGEGWNAGSYSSGNGFVYNSGNFTILPTTGWTDINNNGDIVGNGLTVKNVYTDSTYALPSYSSWSSMDIVAVNDNGLFGGSYMRASYPGGPTNYGVFLYDGSRYTSLGEGILPSYLRDLNDNSQVAYTIDYSQKIYDNGIISTLNPPFGVFSADSMDINNNGDVVVNYVDNNSQTRGLLYSNGVFTEISPSWLISSKTNDINDRGQIVGWGIDSNYIAKSYLYDNGIYTEIIPDGWQSAEVMAINDYGVIVGRGKDSNGVWKGFIATAIVPEPISSILFITGGMLLVGRRLLRRRA